MGPCWKGDVLYPNKKRYSFAWTLFTCSVTSSMRVNDLSVPSVQLGAYDQKFCLCFTLLLLYIIVTVRPESAGLLLRHYLNSCIILQ